MAIFVVFHINVLRILNECLVLVLFWLKDTSSILSIHSSDFPLNTRSSSSLVKIHVDVLSGLVCVLHFLLLVYHSESAVVAAFVESLVILKKDDLLHCEVVVGSCRWSGSCDCSCGNGLD